MPPPRTNAATGSPEVAALRELLIQQIACVREVLDQKLAALADSFGHQLKDIERGIALARTELNSRLGGMNEVREQLTRQSATFITRDAYESRHESLTMAVSELKEFRAVVGAKASQTAMYFTQAATAIGILIGVVGFVLNLLHWKP